VGTLWICSRLKHPGLAMLKFHLRGFFRPMIWTSLRRLRFFARISAPSIKGLPDTSAISSLIARKNPENYRSAFTRSGLPIPSLDEKTHRDILGITTTLRENRDQKRPVVRQLLKQDQEHQNERSMDHMCDLASRMWLMIFVLNAEIDLVDDEAPRKPWLENQSPENLISSLFP
jgi:hypothetical protein